MNISLRKISTISTLKFKLFSRNMYFAVLPLMIIGLAILYKFMLKDMQQLGLTMVVEMNLGMVGIPLTAYMIAEEKEKNTLRALMTSSVSAMDYLIGSSVLPFVITVGLNLILPLILNIPYSDINIPMYGLLTVLSTVSMIIIGFSFGITAKSQSQVSTNVLPISIIVALLPTFSNMSTIVKQISDFTITGVFSNYITEMLENKSYMLDLKSWLIIAAWLIIPMIIFIFVYKKNGMDE
ncbi:ABC transporter permease subunit [Miniphocaeibacter massiliensis]|uniref:ABC transporter permease subunit n=1 Tax=Miniphocaeibacter massiliensis TaxID=2041841 RepID=UPI000C1C81A4|nr:ABC transporter permease subunit [Miniphocaeibacter massiliensis]